MGGENTTPEQEKLRRLLASVRSDSDQLVAVVAQILDLNGGDTASAWVWACDRLRSGRDALGDSWNPEALTRTAAFFLVELAAQSRNNRVKADHLRPD